MSRFGSSPKEPLAIHTKANISIDRITDVTT
jgi:hypothetical protein